MCLRNSRKEACVAGVSKGVRSERRWGHRGTWYRTEVGACRAFEESAASAPPISLQHCPLDARKPSGFLLPLQLSVWGPLLATGVQQGRPGSQFPGSSPQPMWSWWIKYPGTLLLAFDNYEACPRQPPRGPQKHGALVLTAVTHLLTHLVLASFLSCLTSLFISPCSGESPP